MRTTTRTARRIAGAVTALAVVALAVPAAAAVVPTGTATTTTTASRDGDGDGDGDAANPARQAPTARAAQTLTWTADNSTTAYASAPTTATAGPTTIVFENSTATGNTSGLQHSLNFDVGGGDYNDDVDVDILAFPGDENDGRWEVDVTLTEGTYKFLCIIPGHGQMTGELVVSGDGGGGGDDTTPPEVTASLDGETDADGAYLGSATATITATDDSSGVESVEYQVDDLGWQPYTAPVVVDEIGDHTIGYRATDAAGNASAEGNDPFTVVVDDGPDETPPEVEAMVHGEQNADGAFLGTAEVMLMATDTQSEVASVEYTLDGGDWTAYTDPFDVTEVGDHVLTYRATDAAGNVSEPGERDFTVVQAPADDDDAPVVTAVLRGDQDASWAYVGRATATLSATDDGSGVASVEYALDGGAWTEYADPVVVDTTGRHVMRYRATDEGGNVSDGTTPLRVVAAGTAQRCASPDPSPTVRIRQVGSGVLNRDAVGTCTIDDLIRDEARWSSHASFLTHVRGVLAGLRTDGVVTRAERTAIVEAATRSAVGGDA